MQVQEVEDLPEDAARWTGEKVCSNLCTPLDTPADDCCVRYKKLKIFRKMPPDGPVIRCAPLRTLDLPNTR